jgi:Tfp pilus assembly protein PilP
MSETTNAITADAATLKGVFPLHSLQLIGVFGTPESRRALLRQPGGEIEQVEVGAALRQGKVVAIDEDAVILSSARGTRKLAMPGPAKPRVAA